MTSVKAQSSNKCQMSLDKWEISEKLALRRSKYFFDHSRVRFTANSKLALRAQTLSLQPFRLAKNGYRKNLSFALRARFPAFSEISMGSFDI